MSTSFRLSPLVALLLAACATPTPDQANRNSAAAAVGELQLIDMGGQAHDVSATLARGDRVALIFWQTWCGPCRREAPEIARAARDSSDRLRFFGVVPGRDETVDDAKVAATATTWGYRFPQIRDRDLKLSDRFGVHATPTIVVLGEGQEVLFNSNRPPERWADYEGPRVRAD